MLPDLHVIASSVRASRAEFGRIFLQAQIDAVPDPNDRVLFEAVGTSGIDTEAYIAALRRAQAGGWLEALVHQFVAENLEDGRLAQALATDYLDAATLQAMIDASRGLAHPHLAIRRINSGMQWSVKVLVDGLFQGTGVLVGPNLVLTAWHVVRPLFEVGDDETWRPRPDAGPRLRVEFDDFLSFVGARLIPIPHEKLLVQAHERWCVVFSPCHHDELVSVLPTDLSQLEGFWDYAVIRLTKAPGLERAWAALDERATVPRSDSEIMVFQHPVGQPLRFGQGDIVKPNPITRAAVPRLRFLHGVNAFGGTSGGPCFDRTFMLFGLHQGVWRQGDGNDHSAPINRGVPISRMLEHIKAQIQSLPSPDQADVFICQVVEGDYAGPIIGCDAFQSLVWRAALSDRPRLIEITGPDKSGKTFLLSVLSSMLPAAGHLKIALPGRAISKMHAQQLAETICQTAGVAASAIASARDVNVATTTWLRDVVVQQIVTALDGVRHNRHVWILISDLNTTDIQGEHASDLLFALYEQTRTVPWLRVVLDGMRGDIPSALKPLTERYRMPEPTEADVETFVRRAVATTGAPAIGDIRLAVGVAYDAYSDARELNASNAMGHLAEDAARIVRRYLRIVDASNAG